MAQILFSASIHYVNEENSLKSNLRSEMRSQLKEVSSEAIAATSAQICQHIVRSGQLLENVLTIAVYSAHGPEISLKSLHRLLPEIQLVYPLCHAEGRLSFHHVTNPSKLIPGMLGILEPCPAMHRSVSCAEIDLVFCPGLAFGLDGSRLGHGGGYYDRALEGFEGNLCGIALDQQITATVPHEKHDISMDYLISDTGIRSTKSR